jgi:hypothetical protein
LGFVLPQYVPEKISHLPPPVSEVRVATANECQEGWGQRRESELDRERSGWPAPQMHHELCTAGITLSSKLHFKNPQQSARRDAFPFKNSRKIRDPNLLKNQRPSHAQNP